MASSPPAKRQRRDTEITHSDIWHRDGSVVLQAGNKQFRVHWGLLSRHSAFFRDLEGLPQPPDQPSVEGCPVIELSDTAEDVECVLETLYDPLLLTQTALPLPTIASHIRFCRKFDLTNILHSVVQRIVHENPRTLKAYAGLMKGRSYSPTRISHSPGLSIDTVIVARENNLLSVLPCAYLRVILSCSRAQIFNGVRRKDGTLAILPPSDQRLCSLGHADILRDQWNDGNPLGWALFFRNHATNGTILSLGSKPLIWNKLCEPCMNAATRKMSAGRQKMWDSLPPWAELKDDL
ncbi:hypothetical protein B0H15DRAFT_445818 [Mycena belliarum]|uniref:BTB domain-containing protein n=1 Tax=Mycena belliarum TaxID=1033014 RepID=A0AAD6U0D3_9AGAR|nr:hypothetical protein B0H15DRAFT_445818 [Mycena belliae]